MLLFTDIEARNTVEEDNFLFELDLYSVLEQFIILPFERGNKINLGRHHSEEFKRKKSEFMRGRYTGDKAPWWKNEVGYKALHYRIRKALIKPELCAICNKKPPHDVANISGKYLYELTDWQWVCRSCHMRSDGRIHNLRHN